MQKEQSSGLKIMVFIPARNESAALGAVIDGIRKEIHTTTGVDPKIVVGNDGSTDDTAAVAEKHGAEVINHIKAVGLGANFRHGVECALEERVNLLVTIDGDGQFNVQDVGNLIRPILSDEKDFVSGSRFLVSEKPESMPGIKYWGNQKMSQFINSILGTNFRDVSCGYRAYGRKAILSLNLFGGFTYTQEVFLDLAHKGLSIAEVPVRVTYFPQRRSRIAQNLFRYGWSTTKIILSSVLYYSPMWLFGRLAFLLGIPGAILLGGMFVYFARTGEFSPYKYLVLTGVTLVIGSIFLLATGLYLSLMNRMRQVLERILYYTKRSQY